MKSPPGQLYRVLISLDPAMNLSSYVADFTFKVSQLSLSTLPRNLWEYYIEYLWDYKPSSWVARIAYTSRLLAILLILPILVLTLLVCHGLILIRAEY
jgi:hypothetical protein